MKTLSEKQLIAVNGGEGNLVDRYKAWLLKQYVKAIKVGQS